MKNPTSGKHRLLRLVSPFVAVVLFQAFLAGLSLETLSSVRAYVGGEGLWSKSQKDAIHFISLYSRTGDEQFFGRFKVAVAVLLADRAGRYALEQRQQFEIHQVPPGMICFEITETNAIANIPSAKRLIQALKKLGCRFSLDDFGTGMSSFSYLKHLPVDFIKIDGSFVREMLNSEIDRAMVEMIVHIAKVMGKSTVAEFVESNEILETLREIGVDYAQGYAIGKPSPFENAYPLIAVARREVA